METNIKKGSGEPQTRTNGSSQTRNANGQFAPKSSNKVKGETLSADFKDTTGDRPTKCIPSNPVGSNTVKSDLNAPNGSAPQMDENGRFANSEFLPPELFHITRQLTEYRFWLQDFRSFCDGYRDMDETKICDNVISLLNQSGSLISKIAGMEFEYSFVFNDPYYISKKEYDRSKRLQRD